MPIDAHGSSRFPFVGALIFMQMLILLLVKVYCESTSTSCPLSPNLEQTVSDDGSSISWSVRSGKMQPSPTSLESYQPSMHSPCFRGARVSFLKLLTTQSSLRCFTPSFFGGRASVKRPTTRRRRRTRAIMLKREQAIHYPH